MAPGRRRAPRDGRRRGPPARPPGDFELLCPRLPVLRAAGVEPGPAAVPHDGRGNPGLRRQAAAFGYGTVVLQAGEDYGLAAEPLAGVIRQVKAETTLAVTLSLGERPETDLVLWRDAGADRYLLRFENVEPALYDRIHPPLAGRTSNRVAILRRLRLLGYEIGGGVMIGIPGQTYDDLAGDIELFARLDLDMIGVGPFLPHPATPLGADAAAFRRPRASRCRTPN